MPTSVPSKLPRWADNGGAITEPTEGKKNVGWTDLEEPPAPYFNWLLYQIYLWILLLQASILSRTRHTLNFMPVWNGSAQSGTWMWASGTGKLTVTALTSSIAEAAFPLLLETGEKLTGVTVRANKGNGSTMTVTVSLNANGTVSSLGSTTTTATGAVTITPTITAHTVAQFDMITVDVGSGFVGDVIYDVEFTYDRSGGF